ncbi:glycerophosphodiester phosphodiesterase [Saccharopolyspora sp. NPDC002376]
MTHPFLLGPRPRAFAHRGWHLGELHDLENSLSAFRRAVEEGFHYIETDVHATADGVVVVNHDETLERTTDGRGTIRRLPWSAVRTARIGGREPVCSLDAALEELPDTFFNIDVKDDSAVEPVLRTLREHDAWDRVCLASFAEHRLTQLRRAAGPRLLTSTGKRSAGLLWLGSKWGGWPLRSLVVGSAAQVPQEFGSLSVIDRKFVRQAHRWGIEVHVWTVDDPAEMRQLLGIGVDGLVTDRPDVLNDVLRERFGDPRSEIGR